ncbi:hypothetical protein NQZ79_g3262 [Umbelopsis isabellina]|nr:hypothetical protein NQZ79_g3262 [Umbelopsis isabellina]
MTEFKEDFQVGPETITLFDKYLGISDADKLRNHILAISEKLKTSEKTYRCLREYKFVAPRLAPRFYYQHILEDRKRREQNGENPIFMDIGCCFDPIMAIFTISGTDIRQIILDGYPAKSIVGVDLYAHFIRLGYELFQDEGKLQAKFITGNIFDEQFLSTSDEQPSTQPSDLNEYKHNVTYLNAGSVLHLFGNEQIRQFIRRAALLLKPGGLFCGAHVGGNQSGTYERLFDGSIKYFEGKDSLKAILEDNDFTNVDIRATKRLDEPGFKDDKAKRDGFEALWLNFSAVYSPKS